jgi:hypothetical protein
MSTATTLPSATAHDGCGTLVTGDYILDQHIYEGTRYHYADQKPGVQVVVEAGGAAKLAEMLQALLVDSSLPVPGRFVPVVSDRVPPPIDAETPLAFRAYAFWRPKPAEAIRERQFWRCTETMGFGGRPTGTRPEADVPPCRAWPHAPDRPNRPAMIVLSDGGMGFRDDETHWQNLPLATAEHIVLKTAGPLTTAPGLLQLLTRSYADRLTVIVAASELRKSAACIPAGLTWETTFRGFLQELDAASRPEGPLAGLMHCRNLVVPFDSEAAIHVRMATPGALAGALVTFVYHASRIEEDAKYETEGRAFGYLTCFSAAIARGLVLGDERRLAPHMAAGIAAMQNLLAEGHGCAMEPPLGFPTARIARVIRNPQEHFTTATLPCEDLASNPWTFLRIAEPTATSTHRPAMTLARLTAVYGPVALANLPHLRIGDLLTVDGDEVTALRALRQVLRRYRDASEPGSKPLSVGVFGPPGAGKSFSVREIAKNLLGRKADWLEFNLSQFDGPGDLIGAFHQIRDRVLQGKLPVAFFDEFDSQQYRWLQYLLAPMQDGRFQEGESTHTLGRSILIFAGGTSWTYETFGPPEPRAGDSPETVATYEQFRLCKGPDFKSRLDAYLNVVGPNPRMEAETGCDTPPPATPTAAPSRARRSVRVGAHTMSAVEDDVWWPIRRALMLRHQLRLPPDQKLDVDEGLLTALLETPCYHHGSRSLEKILLAVQGGDALRPSFVPHASQLRLQTDPEEFLTLLNRPRRPLEVQAQLEPAELSQMAAAIHKTWDNLMTRRDPSRRPQTLAEYRAACQTPDQVDKADSNLGAAERLVNILGLIGLTLVKGTADEEEERDVRNQLELHLELLASEEHRGWMEWYLQRGWTYHEHRDDSRRRHPCLKPYSELKESEKDKDRNSVRHFPDFAREAGYKLVHRSESR